MAALAAHRKVFTAAVSRSIIPPRPEIVRTHPRRFLTAELATFSVRTKMALRLNE
jgi:hypothetical protein